jgi:arylsulfatase A-like enzyme
VAGEPAAPQPNLILVLIDTLRADHVGAYGYERDTTPVIDELARTGLRFELAISQASWTLPSLMSLFTARYPPESFTTGRDVKGGLALADEEATLAETLARAGYRTVSVSTNPYTVDEIFRLMQGFEEKIFEASAPASWVVDQAIEQIDALRADGVGTPFFLYLHLMDVHAPYAPPPPFDGMFAASGGQSRGPGAPDPAELDTPRLDVRRSEVLARYDGALRFADAELGRLLQQLATLGILDTTVVAIASDHGEAFWDHVGLERTLGLHSQGQPRLFGVGHGHTVFRELVSVPLIINGPGIEPGVAPGPARNLDLATTLLGIAGVRAEALGGDGVNLLHRDRVRSMSALSETSVKNRSQQSLVAGGHQIVRIDGTELFFDITRPGWPRVEVSRQLQADLSRDLDAMISGVPRVVFRETHIDRETLETLRALGYLQ